MPLAAYRAATNLTLETVSDVQQHDLGELLVEGRGEERVLVNRFHQLWRAVGEHDVRHLDLFTTKTRALLS